MKVYFSASISGLKENRENYEKIISTLENLGHTVFQETTKVTTDYVYKEISDEDKVKYYKKVLKWMNQADIIVVEASHPSLSLGHEISLGLEKSTPVIVLYSRGDAPHFLIGVKSDRLIVEKYNEYNLKSILEASLDYASDQQDTRFNFFISPKIAQYLDWVSKTKRQARAVYLRKLITDHMEKNEEYKL